MILRYFSMIGLILFALSPQLTRAEPSFCDYRLHYLEWTQKYFDSADAVFLGKVVADETPDPPAPPAPPVSTQPNSASSMQRLLEQIAAGRARAPPPPRFQTAIFEVVKSWKGPAGPVIVTNSRFLDDYNIAPFKVRESYLIFGYKSDDVGIYFVPSGCAFAEQTKDTASKIRVLDALTKKPGEH